MQTYTCPTCGEKIERDLQLFIKHTDNHILDQIKLSNPLWVTKEGFCMKCFDYFRNTLGRDHSYSNSNEKNTKHPKK